MVFEDGLSGTTARDGSTARPEDLVVVRILVREAIPHAVPQSLCVRRPLKGKRGQRELVGKV
jgi:hypothetical protein